MSQERGTAVSMLRQTLAWPQPLRTFSPRSTTFVVPAGRWMMSSKA